MVGLAERIAVMSDALVVTLVAAALTLICIGVLRLVIVPAAGRLFGAFKLSSVNQYWYLLFILLNGTRALLISFWPRPPAASAGSAVVWMLVCLALLLADRRRLYRVEVLGLAGCGLWHLASISAGLAREGLTIAMGIEALVTVLFLLFLGAILSHPLEVLRRAARIYRQHQGQT